jgi:hypothetical protein
MTKKREINTTAEDTIAIPMSIRLPAKEAYLLHLYAEQMGTSSGKMLTSILEDALPSFEDGEYKITLRMPQVYAAMRNAKLLHGVNEEYLKDRILKRADPGGDQGRPPKARRID